MVFLHLVPAMGALWLLSSVRPLHLRALQGCSIQAALAGVQVRAPHAAVAPAWGGSHRLLLMPLRDARNHQGPE